MNLWLVSDRNGVSQVARRTGKKSGKKKAASKSPTRTASARGKTKKATQKAATKKKVANRKVTKKTAAKKKVAKKKVTKKAVTKKKVAKKAAAKKKVTKKAPVKKASAERATPETTDQQPAPAPHNSVENTEAPAPKRLKSRLKKRELQEFRQLLLAKRALLAGDVANMTDEALRQSRQSGSGELSTMPIHMADLGSDNFEQELTLGLIENEHVLLREIDEALHRIEEGTYGICLGTGKPISKGRLKAKPWAKHCIDYARRLERGF